MTRQSRPAWEVPPLDLVWRALKKDMSMRTNTGGWRTGKLGLTGLDYAPSGIQAQITAPEGVTCYQWTWKQFDTGKPGQIVPFARIGIWSGKELREAALAEPGGGA